MKKSTLIALLAIILLPTLPVVASAQSGNKYVRLSPTKVMDTPRLEVIYEVSEEDPYQTRHQVELFILQNGEKASFFTPYLSYKEDSVCYARSYRVTSAEWNAISDSIGVTGYHPILIKDRTKRTWVVDNFAFGTYVYEEPMKKIVWTLVKGGERDPGSTLSEGGV